MPGDQLVPFCHENIYRNDKNETWKVVIEINTPKAKNGLNLIKNGVKFTEEQEVAEFFGLV